MADVRHCASSNVIILPESLKVMRNTFFSHLRKQKDVVLPEGLQILEQWFKDSEIERVTIPASVREIGPDAFRNCTCLKRVTLASGSTLEKIGPSSFYGAGIERIVISKNVKEIQDAAFWYCKNLKEVVFEAESVLKIIGKYAFC